MELELQITGDGSHTLYAPQLGEHYHSVFGAIQESSHVFLNMGFHPLQASKPTINLLEVGFGAGLNALLTLLQKGNTAVNYTAIEAFPIGQEIVAQLNYPQKINVAEAAPAFQRLHEAEWGKFAEITDGFRLLKIQTKIQDFEPDPGAYDLVYFDAFAPQIQPELWTLEIFRKMRLASSDGGVLVTYSSKGLVKRNLIEAGFTIERLPGPPGKRHMLRATR